MIGNSSSMWGEKMTLTLEKVTRKKDMKRI